MTQNLPGKRVKPGYTIERQPKPTAVRILLILIGVAIPALVSWDLSTWSEDDLEAAGIFSVIYFVVSLYACCWFIGKANENDMIEKSTDASYPNGEIVDDPKDIA